MCLKDLSIGNNNRKIHRISKEQTVLAFDGHYSHNYTPVIERTKEQTIELFAYQHIHHTSCNLLKLAALVPCMTIKMSAISFFRSCRIPQSHATMLRSSNAFEPALMQ